MASRVLGIIQSSEALMIRSSGGLLIFLGYFLNKYPYFYWVFFLT